MILRGADLAAVRAGYDRLLQRLDSQKIRRHWVTGWGDPTVHLVLHPRAATSPDEAAELAGRLLRLEEPAAAGP